MEQDIINRTAEKRKQGRDRRDRTTEIGNPDRRAGTGLPCLGNMGRTARKSWAGTGQPRNVGAGQMGQVSRNK